MSFLGRRMTEGETDQVRRIKGRGCPIPLEREEVEDVAS